MAKKKQRRQPSQALVRRGFEDARSAAAAAGEAPGVLGVFERLAKDRKLTVDKLGELIRLQQMILAADAKSAFEAAYAVMQPEIPRIAKRGIIRNKAGDVQSRYSKYEDIRKIVDPILQRHGFHAHNRTEWPENGVLEVIGCLTHHRGHTRESRFRSKADGSGGKNEIQGLGSGVSYGKRYTLIDLLGIVCEGVDDDGQAHGKAARVVETPAAVYGPQAETKPITIQMRDKLVKLIERTGRDPQVFKRWLAHRYGWDSTKEITLAHYDTICRQVEAPGDLPFREPGE